MQCLVKLKPDGTPVLTSIGKQPTLWRSGSGGPWNPLYRRQERVLVSGDQISIDANNPEGAIFQFENTAMGGGQVGGGQMGYGQQQGGYPQQGYQQQGGYPQQQGGYPQQGGYQQQY